MDVFVLPGVNFLAKHFIPVVISFISVILLHLFVFEHKYLSISPLSVVSTMLAIICTTLFLLLFLSRYIPARDTILRLVALIEFRFKDVIFGRGVGSSAFLVQHVLDEGEKTMKCLHTSSMPVANHAMQRVGINGGLDQWSVNAYVAYSLTWPEEYNLWYPIIHNLFNVPVGWLTNTLHVQDARHYWVSSIAVHPTHVQYAVYGCERGGNLMDNMERVSNLTTRDLLKFMLALAGHVKNLHKPEHNHYHGGIKPENVFIRDGDNGVHPILAEPSVINYIEGAPLPFYSPEQHNLLLDVTQKTDIFSTGQLFKTIKGDRNDLPQQLDALLDQMTVEIADNRPRMDEVVTSLRRMAGNL